MRRSLLILIVILLGSAAITGASYLLGRQLCVQHLAGSGDDLAWLRREFRLSDAEMQRIRQLHEGYLPKCHANCALIAAKKQELQAVLDRAQGMTPEAQQELAEVAALRAQCQANMLGHFYEVSRAMPPEQGRRYLAEMQRLTLGFHEQIESTMSPEPSAHHGHH
jgi:NAD(P)-dependent dehydrogenase (short-subunit alcohol dehydrogenase family)